MEEKIVTLRNLYKLLTAVDYPIPSLAVINEKNKAGLTQNLFLSEICVPQLQQGQVGKMVWRTTGNRNRYFSNLCNCALPMGLYKQYTQEILNVLTPQLVRTQTQRFLSFLQAHDCRKAILKKRLLHWVGQISTNEPENETIKNFFCDLLNQIDNIQEIEIKRQMILLSAVLSWLFIYAITGPCFYELLEPLKEQQELFDLDRQIKRKAEGKSPQIKETCPKFLGQLRQLTGQGLSAKDYYGHDAEVLDIIDYVNENAKVAITGVGGLGKTELVRQVLRHCGQEKYLQNICLVEYNNSIRISFRNAFSSYIQYNNDEEEKIQTLGYLKQHMMGNSLLVIDNMDTLTEDDRRWLDSILEAEYAVIITTRMNSIDGFITVRLTETKPEDCLLIYRSNIGEKVSKSDRELFMSLMNDPLFCHPLTVLLICKAVRQHRNTLEQIIIELQKEKLTLSITTENRSECLASMYRHLYNMCHLTKAEKDLAEFFALLPLGDYEAEWLSNHAPTGSDSKELADALTEMGYLSRTEEGYSMHTLIKQCLKIDRISNDRLTVLLTQFLSYMSGLQSHIIEDEIDLKLHLAINTDRMVMANMLEIILSHSTNTDILRMVFETKLLTSFHVSPEKKKKLRPLVSKTITMAFDDPLLVETYLILYDISIGNIIDPERIKSHYNKLIENDYDLSQPIIIDFLLTGSIQLYSDPELTLQMLETAQRSTKEKRVARLSETHMCFAYYQYGDLEHALECADDLSCQLTEIVDFDDDLFMIFNISTSVYLAIRNTHKVNELCHTMEHILEEDTINSFAYTMIYYEMLNVRAVMKLQEGEYEEALSHLFEYRDYIGIYFGKQHETYFGATEGIAQAYAKLGDFQQAERYYEEAIQFDKGNIPVLFKSIVLNNYAVMLINMKKPYEAIEKLKCSIEVLPENVTSLAEPYRNMARAYDDLGEEETAQKYWSLAYPLLVRNYGEDHERTKEAYLHINL